MENKWLAICLIGVIAAMFSPLVMMEYGKKECRIEAIKAHMPAEDIAKICRP